jgi:hypothetical protein
VEGSDVEKRPLCRVAASRAPPKRGMAKTGASDYRINPGACTNMNIWALYIIAVASLAIAWMLFRLTGPFAACGGSRYEWRARWRLVGKIFLAIAALCFLAAATGQLINQRPG